MTPTQLLKIKGEFEEKFAPLIDWETGNHSDKVWQWIESKLKEVEEEKETIWLIEVERGFAEENFSFVLRQPIEPTKEEVIEYCKVNECVTLDPSYCRIRITTPDKTAK